MTAAGVSSRPGAVPRLIHGGDVYSARERLGREALDFSANINPLGLPDGVRLALEGCAGDCLHYPDPLCRELVAAIAAFEGVPEEWVLCGNGAADLIFRLVWALRPRRGLLFEPTFAEYGQALKAGGADIDRVFLPEKGGFPLPEDAPQRITMGTNLAFVCNPNNPTGQTASPALLERVLAQCARMGCRLALDECFGDFLDEPERFTLKPLLGANRELVLFKAFTKLYAMPGLRLGYVLCSDSALLERMRLCAQSWGVSVPAQRAGVAALREADYRARTRALIRAERAWLRGVLERLGCAVFGSQANYLFFRLPGEDRLREKLEDHGILIRSCGNYPGLGGDYYRAAVRSHAENAILAQALGAILGG